MGNEIGFPRPEEGRAQVPEVRRNPTLTTLVGIAHLSMQGYDREEAHRRILPVREFQPPRLSLRSIPDG